jgi:pimeloyl-ACP methyl ester carboxylesterase
MAAELRPFQVSIPDDVLADLRARIRATRWPDPPTARGWAQGIDPGALRPLVEYWADGFDWRAYEAWLNGFPQFQACIAGLDIHFVHVRSGGGGTPLVLTHGWPSTFVEMLPLVPPLSNPAGHGLPGGSFDLVIPSLPGFGFSSKPTEAGMTTRRIAGLWLELMRQLGYERFGAHGTDFGASVAAFLGLDHPDAVIGLHLTNLDEHPPLDADSTALSPAELEWRREFEGWLAAEHAYADVQATKPQTLGYGLNDSPVGLAAWIVEKWALWGDTRGDPLTRFGRDALCGLLTIYWATQTATSSARIYWEQRRNQQPITPRDRIRVPVAIASFDGHFASEGSLPREWAERLYDVRRWTPVPRGGHFAATEEPELVAADIAAFFASLQR